MDLLDGDSELTIVGFIDDFAENRAREVRGLGVLGAGQDLGAIAARAGIEGILVGFGDVAGRLEAIQRAREAGLCLPSIIHPSAHLSTSAMLESAGQVLTGAYVGPDAQLGLGALVNTHAVVEHDVVLGAGTVVSPGATLAGRVRLGRSVLVGAGATVLPDRVIGDDATVGAGALVTRDVASGVTVVGVPARPHG